MLALQISVNGQVRAVAGTDGATNVCLTVDALGPQLRRLKPDDGPVVVRLGGISGDGEGARANLLHWIAHETCAVGDEVTIRVVDVPAAEVDPPTREALPSGAPLSTKPSFAGWLASLRLGRKGPG